LDGRSFSGPARDLDRCEVARPGARPSRPRCDEWPERHRANVPPPIKPRFTCCISRRQNAGNEVGTTTEFRFASGPVRMDDLHFFSVTRPPPIVPVWRKGRRGFFPRCPQFQSRRQSIESGGFWRCAVGGFSETHPAPRKTVAPARCIPAP